jgi:uncharacterized protein YfaS (alpha-2-macroglobulin family)
MFSHPPKQLFLLLSFLLLLITRSNAQDNYADQWKKVERLAKKNRPGSAYEVTKQIYEQAKKEQQDVQVIKALVYMSGLLSDSWEKNKLYSIRELEKEIISSREPARSILQSMLAEAYWSYFQEVRWKIYNRSKTENSKSYDIETWDISRFHEKISELFMASVQEEKLLQSLSLDQYQPILAAGNARVLRPTLYDLLAHRAVDYFRNDERELTKPAYSLDLDTESAFAPVQEFIDILQQTKDTAAAQHPALFLLRKLLSFHLHDNNPAALIDADINRISFLRSRSGNSNSEQLYLSALTRITEQYPDHPATAQAFYLLAAYYEDRGNKWRPFSTDEFRFDKIKAKEIAEKVVQQERESEGKANCTNLLNRMTLRTIEFQTEEVNIPGKPFRVFIKYSNTPVIYLRILPYKTEYLEQSAEGGFKNTLLNVTPLREWEQPLPSSEDMQPHSVEIKAEALEPGKYFLLASTAKDFTREKTTVAVHDFYVTHISYISRDDDYFILNRDNGQPLAGATIQVWEKLYDYKTQKLNKLKGNAYTTDSNGYFRLQLISANHQNRYYNNPVLFGINYGTDHFFRDDDSRPLYYGRRNNPYSATTDTSGFLFTDRSIYRPGQVLYFKGIVLEKDSTGRSGTVLKKYSATVILQNANRQKTDSMLVTTNEYGSFSGQFNLPASGLTGEYSIYIRNPRGSAGFRVEEYKRPKFAVTFENVKGSYKVNDTIVVTGTAKAFAGNAVDGAGVKYRVVRYPRLIYEWYFRNKSRPVLREKEIASGILTTDDQGKFIVSFKAHPDPEIDKDLDPLFEYVVYADITDINGETRSAEKKINAGYTALRIMHALESSIAIKKMNELPVSTENMNGEFVPALMTVKIYRLRDEKRLIRERLWQRPDQFVMNKAAYTSYFPQDEYDNESDPENRPQENLVFEQSLQTTESRKWPLTVSSGVFSSGYYLVEMTVKDKDGTAIKDRKFIELYNDEEQQLSNPHYLRTAIAGSIEPGDTTYARIGSTADNLFIIQLISRGTAFLKPVSADYSILRLNNENRTIGFTATENDRGGYGVSWIFIKHNRVYKAEQYIGVPWSNKELNIEYLTYRDKTEPGSKETWKIKISGLKKEKAAAELLAGMYDASLDQLYPHSWSKPFPWSDYYNSGYWISAGFSYVTGNPLKYPEPDVITREKVYDKLLSQYVFSPEYRNSTQPLWWLNPLDYAYSEQRNPRLMRLPKPVLPDADGDGVTDQYDQEQTTPGCPVDSRGISLDSDGDGIPDCKHTDEEKPEEQPVKPRVNFNETAFFLPHLYTDSSGTIEFTFTMPESLTQWRFQALAHTKDLSFGYSRKMIITQKQLMVQPNAPRFVREKDKLVFSTKLVNLSSKTMKGEAVLQLLEEGSPVSVDSLFHNTMSKQTVTILPGKSLAVLFPVEIPSSYNHSLTWRILCKASAAPGENYSDGEENSIPVLPNRMLVTESLPLSNSNNDEKKYRFENLLNSSNNKTLSHFSLTAEYTTNPVWYAVQSIPYLMEYPYECAEQTWNRCYANALATGILQSSPRLKEVIDKWGTTDTAALLSNLQKNETLKNVLLEETPWLVDANNEAAQKRKLAALLNLSHMNKELDKAWEKLEQLQTNNGGFAWFKGGSDNRYITQYILSGIGHLKKLLPAGSNKADFTIPEKVIMAAVSYSDKLVKKDYENLKKDKTKLLAYVPGFMEIQYLYMRSFFLKIDIKDKDESAYRFLLEQVARNWGRYSQYMQGMIALALYRNNDKKAAEEILLSLKERALTNEETGMYWAENQPGWYWYEAPIETQSLLIEAFSEIGHDTAAINEMKTWLLKNKQTKSWSTTKATAEACYALLLQGTDWLANEPEVEIKLGNTSVRPSDQDREAGTGYFKQTIEGTKVVPAMGNISVTVNNPASQSPNKPVNQPSWGAVYWQYFEDLDKITTAATPLKLTKKLFIEKNTGSGTVMTQVKEGDILKVGDKIKVRMILQADHDMEYVHLKDMRAAALEPVNVLSSYKWQDGLGYYESTRDASTNFFFDYINKGTYVFEYTLFATHAGNFSNGISTVQCMYAPKFSAHSEGIRITIQQ